MSKITKKQPIRSIDGHEPHESWGGWTKFLASCDVRGSHGGVVWYGKSNCNYFLFPDGIVFENFGYHADALWRRIQHEGADVVLDRIKRRYEIMVRLNAALDQHNLQLTYEIGRELDLLQNSH